MFQCTPFSIVLWVAGEEAMRTTPPTTGAMRQFNRLHLAELSAGAKRRLKWFDWHAAHGENVSLTCRHFAISRQTFYRWQRRYKPWDLTTLEDRSSRPTKRRQRTWTTAQVLAVQRLREGHPRWGKAKLCVLLLREGIRLSVSMVGRILSYLKGTGKLKEPRRRTRSQRRRWQRPYATRKPKEYLAVRPGDLVQLDTLDLRLGNSSLKQFSAVDSISRWSVATVASNATARTARRALEAILERMPFAVRAIQVDGGSEFMAGFEEACKERGILLFVLPPRSPKLNGRVERLNRTYREEHYDCTNVVDFTVAALSPDLRRWEEVYNTVRPHQALGYLTPAEYLTHLTQEELSRTS